LSKKTLWASKIESYVKPLSIATLDKISLFLSYPKSYNYHLLELVKKDDHKAISIWPIDKSELRTDDI